MHKRNEYSCHIYEFYRPHMTHTHHNTILDSLKIERSMSRATQTHSFFLFNSSDLCSYKCMYSRNFLFSYYFIRIFEQELFLIQLYFYFPNLQ